MQAFTRGLETDLRGEIGHVHGQRVAFPAATRVAEPLPGRGWQMCTGIDRDDPLPSLPLAGIVEDRNRSAGLHDAAVPAEVGQYRAHAALRHAAILGTVVPIGTAGVVERRHLGPSKRWRTILAAGAGSILVL